MQCACAILPSVACPVLLYFSTLFHKQYDFRKKNVIRHKMYVLIISTPLVWKISYSKQMWVRYDQEHFFGLHVKYPLFLLDFNETWIFVSEFRKILKYKTSWKSVQWEPSCSIWTDGRTDVTNLIVSFCNFAKVPKRKECFV